MKYGLLKLRIDKEFGKSKKRMMKMIGNWAIVGGIIGLVIGIKEGGMAIFTGPIIFAAIGAGIRRWIFRKFGL